MAYQQRRLKQIVLQDLLKVDYNIILECKCLLRVISIHCGDYLRFCDFETPWLFLTELSACISFLLLFFFYFGFCFKLNKESSNIDKHTPYTLPKRTGRS